MEWPAQPQSVPCPPPHSHQHPEMPPPQTDADPPGENHTASLFQAPSATTPSISPHVRTQPRAVPSPVPLLSPHLPDCFHLCQVPAAQSHPAPAPVGVVHLLSWHPGLGPPVRRDGDAILPTWGARGQQGEGGRRTPNSPPTPPHIQPHQRGDG